MSLERLSAALADRYTIERELGQWLDAKMPRPDTTGLGVRVAKHAVETWQEPQYMSSPELAPWRGRCRRWESNPHELLLRDLPGFRVYRSATPAPVTRLSGHGVSTRFRQVSIEPHAELVRILGGQVTRNAHR